MWGRVTIKRFSTPVSLTAFHNHNLQDKFYFPQFKRMHAILDDVHLQPLCRSRYSPGIEQNCLLVLAHCCLDSIQDKSAWVVKEAYINAVFNLIIIIRTNVDLRSARQWRVILCLSGLWCGSVWWVGKILKFPRNIHLQMQARLVCWVLTANGREDWRILLCRNEVSSSLEYNIL